MKKVSKRLKQGARKLIAYTEPQSHVSEQYRTLRTNINFSSPDKRIQTLVITSAAPAEGKSTTAANLAVVYAQEGKSVLLIDGDLRKPTMQHTFKTQNVMGLSSILSRQVSLKTSIKKTGVSGLSILTSGQIPPNPAELLASKSMDTLLDELKSKFDLIIFDSPPLLSVTDAQILANKCDGVILVLNSKSTEKQQAVKAKGMIALSKSKLIGVVLNNYSSKKGDYYNMYTHVSTL